MKLPSGVDSGCELFSSCLACPTEICAEELEHGDRIWLASVALREGYERDDPRLVGLVEEAFARA